MAKKKKQKRLTLLVNKNVTSYVWAVILVVTIPALYIVFFAAQANKNLASSRADSSVVQGYVSEEACAKDMNTNCYQVTTVQQDVYWVPQQ